MNQTQRYMLVDEASGVSETQKAASLPPSFAPKLRRTGRRLQKVRLGELVIFGAMLGATFVCVLVAILTAIHFSGQ
jgi:hypothetical protein